MKKIVLFAALAATLTASAEVLTPAQALLRLEQSEELQNYPAVRRMAARKASAAMPMKTISGADGRPQLYLFAEDGNGLMLLSAESEAEPLMGYTDSYTPGDALPPALEYMIDCYAAEIEALRSGAVTYSTESTFDLNSPAIEPICTTKWDQGAPYNDMCPTISGMRSVTGCVATAMAQVLKTYEHPVKCSGGTYSYTWASGGSTLSMNFDEVEFDWDAMADSYTESESAPEVAELMKAVGYASQMDYSPYASGAHGSSLAAGLVRNFDFDCTLSHELREWYSLGEWQQKIYDVIAGGHAIYYDGANPDNSAAHAFVVDGYRGDGFFHLNWGWGGMSDGYFRLTALDPSAQGIGGSTAGYDRGQGAIFNLTPGATTAIADAPLIFFMTNGFRASTTTGKLMTAISFRSPQNGAIYNNGPNTVSMPQFAVKFTKSTGEEFWFHESTTRTGSVQPYSGAYYTFSCKLTRDLTDGTYTVSPAIYNPRTEEYFDVRYPVGIGATFTAEVVGDDITFSLPVQATLAAEELTVPEIIYQNTSFEISAKLTNPTTEEYYGPINAVLLKKGGTSVVATIGAMVISAAPEQTVDIAAYFKVADKMADVGEYDVALIDQNGDMISETVGVTLEEQQPQGALKCTRISATNKSKDQLTFKLKLTCTGGMYVNPVYVVLTEYGKYTALTYYASPMLSLEPSSTTEVEVVCNFTEGEPGKRYTAYPYYQNGDNLTQMQGSSISFYLEEPTSIENIEQDSTAPVEYFDLGGRRVAEPGSGIFIRKQGSNISKVLR